MPRPGVRPAPPAPALSRPKVGPRVVGAHSPIHNSCVFCSLKYFKDCTILSPPLLKGGGPPRSGGGGIRRRELPKKSALEKRGVAGNSRKSQHWRKEASQSPLRKSPSTPQWSPESSPPASPGAPAAPSRSPPPSAGSESRRKPRPKIPTSSATLPAGRPANSGPPS